MRNWRLVGGRIGLGELIRDVGESVRRSEESIRCGEFRKVSGGLRWISASRDTRAVGAEARAVESGMDGGLGRVKECAPGGELPSRNDRESFADKHGSGTFWAAGTSGLGGRGSDGCGAVWRGIVGEQTLTEGQERGASAIGEEADRANADKTARQDSGAGSGVRTLANRAS
jgi:hypothetical protein